MSLNSSTNLTVFQRSEWYLQSLKTGMANALRTCTQRIACVCTCRGRWNGQERWCSRPRSCPGHPSGVCTTRSGLRPVNGAVGVSTPVKTKGTVQMPRSGSRFIDSNQSSFELLHDHLGCWRVGSLCGADRTSRGGSPEHLFRIPPVMADDRIAPGLNYGSWHRIAPQLAGVSHG